MAVSAVTDYWTLGGLIDRWTVKEPLQKPDYRDSRPYKSMVYKKQKLAKWDFAEIP